MRSSWIFVLVLPVLSVGLAGCGEEGGSARRVCEPGATQPCSCGGDTEGTRSCNPDGQSWGACQCVEPDVVEDMGLDAGPDAPEDLTVDSAEDPLEDADVTPADATEESDATDTAEEPATDPVEDIGEDALDLHDEDEGAEVTCASIEALRALADTVFPVPDSCDDGNPCPGALACVEGECELPDFCDDGSPCPTDPAGIECVDNICVQAVELAQPQQLCDVMVTYHYDTGSEAGFFVQDGIVGPAIRAATAEGDSLDRGATYDLIVTRLVKDERNLRIAAYSALTEKAPGDVPSEWVQQVVDGHGDALDLDAAYADELVRLEGDVTWVSYDDSRARVEYGTATTAEASLRLREAATPPCTGGTLQIVAMVTWDTRANRWIIESWAGEDLTPGTLSCPSPPDAGAGGSWLIVNEVLADDEDNDANCDGVADDAEDDDELVEIINVSDSVITLQGVAIWDEDQPHDDPAAAPRYIFDDVLLAPGEAIVVFGGGQPGLCIYDDDVDCDATCNDIDWPTFVRMETSFAGLDLDDGGERLVLTDPAFDLETRNDAENHVLHRADYGSASSESSNRNPDVVGVEWEDHSIIDQDPPYDDSPFTPGTTAHGFPFWGYCTPDTDIQALRDGDDDSGQLCGVVITYIAPGLGFFVQERTAEGPAILVEDADDFETVRVGEVIDMSVTRTVASDGNTLIAESTGLSAGDGYVPGSIGFHWTRLTAVELEQDIRKDITELDLFAGDAGDLVLDELIAIGGVQVLEIDPDDDADPDVLEVTYSGLSGSPILLFLPDGTNDFGGANSVGSTFDVIRGFVRRVGTGSGNYALFVWNPDFWTDPDNDDPDIDHFVPSE